MFAVSFKLRDGGRRHREFSISEYDVTAFETCYLASDARFIYSKYCAYVGYDESCLCYDSVLRLQWGGPHLSLHKKLDVSHTMRLAEELSGLRVAEILGVAWRREYAGRAVFRRFSLEIVNDLEQTIRDNLSLVDAYEKSTICSSLYHYNCGGNAGTGRVDKEVFTPAVQQALETKMSRLLRGTMLFELLATCEELDRQEADDKRRQRERQIARGRAEIEALLGVNPDTLDELYDLLRVKEIES